MGLFQPAQKQKCGGKRFANQWVAVGARAAPPARWLAAVNSGLTRIGGGGDIAGDWWCACAGDARERGAVRGTYLSISIYIYILLLLLLSLSLAFHLLFFFGERRMPSSGGIESLAWRRHTEPRSLMISQSWAKIKLAHHNHARKKNKKNRTSASIITHRPRQKAQAGRPARQVVSLRTHAHRAAARHRHRWRVGKRGHRDRGV